MFNLNKAPCLNRLSKNFLHIVFSTKYRDPWIDSEVELSLHGYLGGICSELESPALKIGGYNDHVHILCLLSKKITVIRFLEEIKAHSSKWIKTQGRRYHNFYWQGGYGAFSVSPKDVDKVKIYIANQHIHHRSESFQDEFRRILSDNDVGYDERYIWE